MNFFAFVEHFVFVSVLAWLISVVVAEGATGIGRLCLHFLRKFPPTAALIKFVLRRKVGEFIAKQKGKSSKHPAPLLAIPEVGLSIDELTRKLKERKGTEINPEDGKIFAYVYTGEGDTFEVQREAYNLFCEKSGLEKAEHDDVLRMFYHAFMHENALNPMIFPSLRDFENQLLSMTAWMLHGDPDVVGSLTSGGTESILMAMKTYRDRARKYKPHIQNPEMVAPITIHPAHEKAANYFGFRIVHVPVGDDYRADVGAYEAAVNERTIALLCSAPQYCHGVVDPVKEIGAIARKHQLPLHVDACFGGFMLPWVEKLGYPVPLWDFRVPEVTSISADIHKYGFSAKGASVILYRDEELRKFQYFAYSGWPGGLFGSPSMAGTRPGGNIAAAWAALQSCGQSGYLQTAKKLMTLTRTLTDGVKAIPGLTVLGDPDMTSFAVGSDDPDVNILVVADLMEKSGWKPERQQNPACLHFTIMPHHLKSADQLLAVLRKTALQAKADPTLDDSGSAGMYGFVSKIPDKALIDDFILEFFSEIYKL